MNHLAINHVRCCVVQYFVITSCCNSPKKWNNNVKCNKIKYEFIYIYLQQDWGTRNSFLCVVNPAITPISLTLGKNVRGIQGVPKKGGSLFQGHRGHQKWTKDKSRVSFGKFRKFPFQWAQKHPIFVKKRLRNIRSNMATPLLKKGIIWGYHDN